MPRGRPKKKFKQSDNPDINSKLNKSQRRRVLDKVRHDEQRHGEEGFGEQGRGDEGRDEEGYDQQGQQGGSDEQELSEQGRCRSGQGLGKETCTCNALVTRL